MKVYDLYTGLHGWLEPFLAEGYECVGYDIEDMCASLGIARPPGIEFRMRDVRSIHGSELKDATIIVASPPCQAYSYRAMPWKRAKALPPPDNTLFNECFRIQREASEAAGHYIPLIVENVLGAQRWVGRARWHYGSFYLWGDVPALMPPVTRVQKFNPDGTNHPPGSWFAIADSKNRGSGSWFNVAHNTISGKGNNPDGRKGVPHRTRGHWTNPAENICSCPTECDCENPEPEDEEAVAHCSQGCPIHNLRPSPSPTCPVHGESKAINPSEHEGKKNGGDWFGSGSNCSLQWRASRKSTSRKAASAQVAKIPLPLAQHIARVFKPTSASTGAQPREASRLIARSTVSVRELPAPHPSTAQAAAKA